MIKIVGYWELGWNTPIKEMDLWEYPLQDFSVDTLYMIPVSGIANKNVIECASLDDVILQNPDLTVVFVDEYAKTNLKEFVHPTNALYVFGKSGFSPHMSLNAMKNNLSVKIETKVNKGLLWPHQAASIILYDRMLKGD